ncbi:diguanylate cyclase [Pseudomonas putida]|uniref:Diguanylate cyclase n=1 Tax=Pseudomonas putida TaxID=303 RepID=A0A1L5PTU6_PSEPU|nr:diguanylate cyclase [Pseudomonas putida]
MGAGLPANTGAAGAMHRVTFFAGEPAPTQDRATFNYLAASGN